MEKLSLESRFSDIEYNIGVIKERIAAAAVKSGRSENDVTLMAVTKTVEPVFINHAISCGIDLIGENKVQEFLGKKQHLNLSGCEAHLIGHLQTNKVRQIVSEVSMIQSVDSVRLAREISKRSEMAGITTDCLIEVNIGDEESKTGFDKGAFIESLSEISELPSIKVKGLMTIPPICDNPAEAEKYFATMSDFYNEIKEGNYPNFDFNILSMGMSGDYKEAIIHGSNLVRIGSSIFGARIYK